MQVRLMHWFFILVFPTLSPHQFSFFSLAFIFSLSPLTARLSFWPYCFSVYQWPISLFFSLNFSLVSYFSLAPCARLYSQFSVSFEAHVKSSSSYRIVLDQWCLTRMACLQRLAGTDQCRCGVGLSSERKDDQDDVLIPHQVNDQMLGQLGNVGHCVLESPE